MATGGSDNLTFAARSCTNANADFTDQRHGNLATITGTEYSAATERRILRRVPDGNNPCFLHAVPHHVQLHE